MSKTKTATIKLNHYKRIPTDPASREMESAWRVIAITDSLDYTPGESLDRNTVDALCASRAWKVSIT